MIQYHPYPQKTLSDVPSLPNPGPQFTLYTLLPSCPNWETPKPCYPQQGKANRPFQWFLEGSSCQKSGSAPRQEMSLWASLLAQLSWAPCERGEGWDTPRPSLPSMGQAHWRSKKLTPSSCKGTAAAIFT